MILLLGGTTETAVLAEALARVGYRVLVSSATEIPQELASIPGITRRAGPLDDRGMALVIIKRNIAAIVDCTHPYAQKVRSTARTAAKAAGIPYFTLIRPESVSRGEDVLFAGSHEEAAEMACSFRVPVFLTTGSRNLEPYVQASRKTGVKLVVRVLPEESSLKACAAAGIVPSCIVTGRGPFSVKKNRETLKKFGIGVLVTKDSGEPGGVREKIEAARLEGCRIVTIRRPPKPALGVYQYPADLIAAVTAAVSKE
jgi:precorrin-6A/cobalt-precorrin-6A reductase